MEPSSRYSEPVIAGELLTRVGLGDHQAFSHLYDQSSPLLFGLAKRILGEEEEAMEVLQEIYAEVWQRAAQFDPGRGSPLAWLIVLTRNRAIDRLRSRMRRSRVVVDVPEGFPLSPTHVDTADPHNSYVVQELRVKVVEALTELPLEQRRALELAYYVRLSNSEIASQLNEQLGTIKTRIRLAMGKLKNSLRACWVQE